MGKGARSWIAAIAIIGILAGGWLLFRDRLSGAADSLRVGDCFDVPTGQTISSLQHQPCTEAHDGEAYVVGTIEGDSYPVVFGFDDWVEANCLGSAFESYVGEPVEARADIEIGYFSPTREGWEDGDREITCYLTPADGQKVTTSYRAAPAAS